MQNSERQDIYTRVTTKIIASLEQGVRPWIKNRGVEKTPPHDSVAHYATTARLTPASTS